MAALQWLSKYRETGLLLIRASLGFMFIVLLVPILWQGQGEWERFGSVMRVLDVQGHYKFLGFLGASLGIIGGVLMILGLFFRVGVLLTLIINMVHVVAVWQMRGDFYSRMPVVEISILLLGVLFVGPGKYSVDKN